MNPPTIIHAGTKYVSVDALRLACTSEHVLVNVACLLKVAVHRREKIETALSIMLAGFTTHISGDIAPISFSPEEQTEISEQLKAPLGIFADDSWPGARLIVEMKSVKEGMSLRIRREGKTDHPVQSLFMGSIEKAVHAGLRDASTTVRPLGVVEKLEIEGTAPPGLEKIAFRRDEAPPSSRPPEPGRN